jgi:hypothetical protein
VAVIRVQVVAGTLVTDEATVVAYPVAGVLSAAESAKIPTPKFIVTAPYTYADIVTVLPAKYAAFSVSTDCIMYTPVEVLV